MNTKLFLAVSFALLTLNVGTGFAASAPAETFTQRKAERLQRIDQRINHLQTQKNCVQEATVPMRSRIVRRFKGGERKHGSVENSPAGGVGSDFVFEL